MYLVSENFEFSFYPFDLFILFIYYVHFLRKSLPTSFLLYNRAPYHTSIDALGTVTPCKAYPVVNSKSGSVYKPVFSSVTLIVVSQMLCSLKCFLLHIFAYRFLVR